MLKKSGSKSLAIEEYSDFFERRMKEMELEEEVLDLNVE